MTHVSATSRTWHAAQRSPIKRICRGTGGCTGTDTLAEGRGHSTGSSQCFSSRPSDCAHHHVVGRAPRAVSSQLTSAAPMAAIASAASCRTIACTCARRQRLCHGFHLCANRRVLENSGQRRQCAHVLHLRVTVDTVSQQLRLQYAAPPPGPSCTPPHVPTTPRGPAGPAWRSAMAHGRLRCAVHTRVSTSTASSVPMCLSQKMHRVRCEAHEWSAAPCCVQAAPDSHLGNGVALAHQRSRQVGHCWRLLGGHITLCTQQEDVFMFTVTTCAPSAAISSEGLLSGLREKNASTRGCRCLRQ